MTSYRERNKAAKKKAVKKRLNQYGDSVKHPDRDYGKEAKYQADPDLVNHRERTNQYNRRKGTYGNHDRKDASATGVRGKIKGLESEKANRSRKR